MCVCVSAFWDELQPSVPIWTQGKTQKKVQKDPRGAPDNNKEECELLTVYTFAEPGSDDLHSWQQWTNSNMKFKYKAGDGKFLPY